jgi:23S rRNA (uracil1939-C5)-methyltransferase
VSRPVEVRIEALGAQGDGLARAPDGTRLYVPGALPGERVAVRVQGRRGDGLLAEVRDILETAPDRARPFCPLFGRCGGCALQHLDPRTHAAWKKAQVEESLARRGLGLLVAPVVLVPRGTRRRATFGILRTAAGVVLGFSARLSHRVIDLPACPLLTPALNDLLGPLREALADVLRPGERGTVKVTRTVDGIDVLLGLKREPGPRECRSLAGVEAVGRFSWRGEDGGVPEPLLQLRRLHVSLSGQAVEFPPGAFLQPSPEGEAELVRLVRDGCAGARRVFDLHAGLGTFAFALAGDGATVKAFEADEAAVAAMRQAAGRAGLGGRLAAEARDLDRRPLAGGELKGCDALVLDPPRAGARAQAEALASAGKGPERLVAVSCDPATLARDLRILVDGGWRVERLVPVDQFPFAAHVEAVAFLSR